MIFDCVHLLYYKCQKRYPNRGESYIDSLDWIKNKKTTMNPINKKGNTCFQYAVTVALNHGEIEKHSKSITKTKPFMNKCNCEEINFQSEKDNWKKFEKNNRALALNILYTKREKTYSTYVLKHNLNREKQVILLMIPNGEGWHCLAVERLSDLLRGITSKYHRDFFCLNCLHSFARENKCKSHKKVCENKDFCNVIMLSENTKILQFNENQKSDKAPLVIYADLQCLTEKIDGCKNNPEISSTSKAGEHISSGFSISTASSLKSIEDKYDVYRGNDCMKKLCETLRDHAIRIVSFKRKKIKLLTKEQQESYQNEEICYI